LKKKKEKKDENENPLHILSHFIIGPGVRFSPEQRAGQVTSPKATPKGGD
jgi:hypothetical protein